MKCLYRFNLDCGRMGELSGLFIATEEQLNEVIGKEIYYGEVLGKHSDLDEVLEEDQLELMTADPDTIEILENCFPYEFSEYHGLTLSGINPLEYYDPVD